MGKKSIKKKKDNSPKWSDNSVGVNVMIFTFFFIIGGLLTYSIFFRKPGDWPFNTPDVHNITSDSGSSMDEDHRVDKKTLGPGEVKRDAIKKTKRKNKNAKGKGKGYLLEESTAVDIPSFDPHMHGFQLTFTGKDGIPVYVTPYLIPSDIDVRIKAYNEEYHPYFSANPNEILRRLVIEEAADFQGEKEITKSFLEYITLAVSLGRGTEVPIEYNERLYNIIPAEPQ